MGFAGGSGRAHLPAVFTRAHALVLALVPHLLAVVAAALLGATIPTPMLSAPPVRARSLIPATRLVRGRQTTPRTGDIPSGRHSARQATITCPRTAGTSSAGSGGGKGSGEEQSTVQSNAGEPAESGRSGRHGEPASRGRGNELDVQSNSPCSLEHHRRKRRGALGGGRGRYFTATRRGRPIQCYCISGL